MTATNYLNIPWKSGGTDTDGFDCWGLVSHWYSERLGISLPSFPSEGADIASIARGFCALEEDGRWEELTEPEDNCIVAMGRNTIVTHSGVYIGEGFVLHILRDTRFSIAQSTAQIRRRYRTVKFYKYHDNPGQIRQPIQDA